MGPGVFIGSGLLLALAGSIFLYLASPHQRGLARPLAAGPACSAGGVLLALGLALVWQVMHAVAAAFLFATWLMLLFLLLPYLGALFFIVRSR
jgi:hypothetical protein